MSTSARKRSLPAEISQAKQKQARTSQASCGPCRARVSRCDKQRPCSSCILANTQSQCYPDASSYQPPPSYLVSRATTRRGSHSHRILGAPMGRRGSSGQQLYEGPTAVLVTLAPLQDESPEVPPADPALGRIRKPYRPDKDLDIVSKLPPRDVCERVVDYYFEHCTWLYKYFDRRAFTERFTRWRTDEETDSLTLAGLAIICAIVVHCLPPHHELASTLKVFPEYQPLPPGASEKDIQSARERAHADSTVNRAGVIGAQFYDACELALEREKAGSKVQVWTMDFLEVVLGKCHYLGLSRVDTEELWALRGDLVSMATALGLHRYPGKNVPHLVAERHRWIWGNIIFLERWQALMHGRPLSILPEHFDVALPSPEPIPLPCPINPDDAQPSFDLSGDPSTTSGAPASDQSLMPSLSRHGRNDSMPNISTLDIDSADPLASPVEQLRSFNIGDGGHSVEGWAQTADSSQPSSAPARTSKIPNQFALSLDPTTLLLDPGQEAQMFGLLPTSSSMFEDVSDTGYLGGDDYSSWSNTLNTQSSLASGSGLQGEDFGKILRTLPGPEESGTRTYEAHVAHFHLAHILGRVVEDLLSLCPVAYARIQSRDDELQRFMDALTPSLKLSAEEITQQLISQHTGLRRQGVQALVVKMAALHIRFMLHRPYASGEVEEWPSFPPQASSRAKGKQTEVEAYLEAQKEKDHRREVRVRADEHATSLAKAIEAAQGLIELAAATVPMMTHANTCAEHAHLNWAPVQVTGAALFLIYVVVTSPTPHSENEESTEPTIPQPISASSSASSNSNLSYPSLNACILLPVIRLALKLLQDIAYMPTAHNSASLLLHLQPLFAEGFVLSSKEDRIKIKRETLMSVERLNMPYRDGGTVGIVGGISPPAPPAVPARRVQTPSMDPSVLQETRRSSDVGIIRAPPMADEVTPIRPQQPTRSASLHHPPPRISAPKPDSTTRSRVHFAQDPPRPMQPPVLHPTSILKRTSQTKSQTAGAPASTQSAAPAVPPPVLSTHTNETQPSGPSSSTQSTTQDTPQWLPPQTVQMTPQAQAVPPQAPHPMQALPPPLGSTHVAYPQSFTSGPTPYFTDYAQPPPGGAQSSPPSQRPPLAEASTVTQHAPPVTLPAPEQTSSMPPPAALPPQASQMQLPPPLPHMQQPSTTAFGHSMPQLPYPPPGLPPTQSAFSNLSQSTSASTGIPPPYPPLSTPSSTSGYAIFSGYPDGQPPELYPQPPSVSAQYVHGSRLGYPPGFNMNNVYAPPTGGGNTVPTPSSASPSVPAPPPAHASLPAHLPAPPQAGLKAPGYGGAMWYPQQTPVQVPPPPTLSNMAPPFTDTGVYGPGSAATFAGRASTYGQPGAPYAQGAYSQQGLPQALQVYGQPSAPFGQQGAPYSQPQASYGHQGLAAYGQQSALQEQSVYAQQAAPYGQASAQMPGQQSGSNLQGGYGGSAQGQPMYGPSGAHTPVQYGHPGAYGQPSAYGQQSVAHGQPDSYGPSVAPHHQQQHFESVGHDGMDQFPVGHWQAAPSNGQASAPGSSMQTFSHGQTQYFGSGGQQ